MKGREEKRREIRGWGDAVYVAVRARPDDWLGLVATNAREAYLAASGHLNKQSLEG